MALTVDPTALMDWVARHDDLMIVDVRGGAEFDSLHIKSSYHAHRGLQQLGEAR
ncbi:hypothetical protein [Sinomonas terrae]|uniref:Sulfurtransferase n=1 Tax=Sinomonas terrae TaxID=2908838 RepID=A0ABS9U585_9MICC|nr:hypothetical protein [Sinomonas terrae]MCH6471849.1 hypothetical protein [Sinomonas terrae]